MRRCIAALAGLMLLSLGADAAELSDFTSDGCSLFPDGIPGSDPGLWCDCCLMHDVAYWRGGTAAEREQADAALRDCVYARTGDQNLAELMYGGVRAGGHPVFPTWYRWGYGWDYGRGYAALTDAERTQVKKKMSVYRERGVEFSCVAPGAVALPE